MCHLRIFLKLSLCSQVPTKNIEGQLTPYYPVEMGHGTRCSLRQNTPRSTTVLYVCHPEAKHEILTIAEVITCQYEVVVLTPLLCSHPKYRYIHKHLQSQFPFLVLCDRIQPIFPQVQVLPSEWHLLPGSGWLPSQTSESVPAGSWAGRAAQTTVQLKWRQRTERIQSEYTSALYLHTNLLGDKGAVMNNCCKK